MFFYAGSEPDYVEFRIRGDACAHTFRRSRSGTHSCAGRRKGLYDDAFRCDVPQTSSSKASEALQYDAFRRGLLVTAF